ncbi:hypothetical protein IW245_004514 [Longispora fulva]|uniref:Uncharacterized protein n=1 Tax=Longispora fulva TaxID=619741 RepID=A0A8J7GMJ6_9ACTN|nr:hypothetical protein [Longispora fulva]
MGVAGDSRPSELLWRHVDVHVDPARDVGLIADGDTR